VVLAVLAGVGARRPPRLDRRIAVLLALVALGLLLHAGARAVIDDEAAAKLTLKLAVVAELVAAVWAGVAATRSVPERAQPGA
jgi:hypothetical protein